MHRLLVPLGLLLLSACATVTQGTTESITVTSEPTAATCTLQRDGALIGAVNPTPGSVTVSRSTRDITVRCERQGVQPAVQTVSANFQAMTLGNILLGGVVGIVIDAASGAMGDYPPNVHVVMPPLGAAAGRAAWFEARRRELVAQADERIAAVRASGCEGSRRAACDRAVGLILEQRDRDLAELDRQRAAEPAT